jgi:glycosyltransferase involved in cell wall biosynthesis
LGLEAHQIVDSSTLTSIQAGLAVRRHVGAVRPAIVHTHDYRTNLLAGLAARRAGLKWVATVHLHTNTTARLRLYARLDLHLLRLADRVIAVSQALAQRLRASGIQPGRLRVVHNGVDVEALVHQAQDPAAARHRFGIAAGAPLVVLPGRLSPQKGQAELLAAVPAVLVRQPATVFAFAGDGPQRERLNSRAHELGAAHAVHWLGYDTRLPELLSAADVVVLPSRDEGLPLALLEAMALGRPIVATTAGGMCEAIDDGREGLIVDAARPAELAEAIVRLCSDAHMAGQLGARAQARVRRQFSLDQAADRLAAVYDELLD